MPTYQYACTECGHAFEQFQSFSDAALTACPQCSGRLRKLYSAVGVVFKGSGFYRTDSRTDSHTDSPGVEKTGTDKGDKGDKPSGDKPSGDKTKGSPAASGSGEKSGSPSPDKQPAAATS